MGTEDTLNPALGPEPAVTGKLTTKQVGAGATVLAHILSAPCHSGGEPELCALGECACREHSHALDCLCHGTGWVMNPAAVRVAWAMVDRAHEVAAGLRAAYGNYTMGIIRADTLDDFAYLRAQELEAAGAPRPGAR